jgi:hypothetical protein
MREAWRRFLEHRLAVLGLGVIAILVVLAVGVRVFSPHDPLGGTCRARLPDRPPTSARDRRVGRCISRGFSTARPVVARR